MVTFPRQKSEELQEALGHLEFFKSQIGAIEFALKRLGDDRRLCEKEVTRWEKRIEKLGWLDSNYADKP